MSKNILSYEDVINLISESLYRVDGETLEAVARSCGLTSVKYTGDSMFSVKKDWKEGDACIVPDPEEYDLWQHEFQGHIVSLRDDGVAGVFAQVSDQDDDVWDVLVDNLKDPEDDNA